MKKFFILCLFFVGVISGFSQQNRFFREVKEYFDEHEKELDNRFNTYYFLASEEQKVKMKEEYNLVKSKIDSTRNSEYLEALIKTKIAADLGLMEQEEVKSIEKRKNYNSDAEYPMGIAGLREELMQKFYQDAISGEKELKITLTFIVEEDGSLSNVQSQGEHIGLNRQAEIALYLLSNRFIPAYRNGIPVKSKFRFPLKMRFE